MDPVNQAPEQNQPPENDRQAPLGRTLSALSPGAYPLTGSELLAITLNGSLAGVTVTVRARTWTQRGGIQRHEFKAVAPSNRVPVIAVKPIGDGFLLDITARVTVGTPLWGQTSCIVDLVQGLSGEQQPLTTLLAGYLTANNPLFGPVDVPFTFVDGPGAVRVIVGTTPGAGVNITETVPAGARWELVSFTAVLVASAAVATRSPMLILDDGANVYCNSLQNGTQAASTTWSYGWSIGMQNFVTMNSNDQHTGLPADNRMLAGHRIRTFTQALQAGDQYNAPVYLVREWLEM